MNLTSVATGLQATAVTRYLQKITYEVVTPPRIIMGMYINCNNVITGYSVCVKFTHKQNNYYEA